jgi:hypothetical protein
MKLKDHIQTVLDNLPPEVKEVEFDLMIDGALEVYDNSIILVNGALTRIKFKVRRN